MVNFHVGHTEAATLIANGEDSFTEFKSAGTSTKAVAKELCAFLNTAGGRLFLGVEDDGTTTGLGTWTEEVVMNVGRTLIQPAVTPRWQSLELAGTRVAIVSVDRGTDKPYAVGGGESKNYYVRVGSTSREASREDLVRLTQASGAVQPDLRPVAGASPDDLEGAALAQRFGRRRSFDWATLSPKEREGVLVSAEILHPETRTPTVGGLVCFGRDPSDRLPQAAITCAAFPGDGIDRELIDRADVRGRVEVQVAEAVAFVRRNLRSPSDVVGVERHEEVRPSEESLREVVANAVAHRDYSVGAPVQLRVFRDRLEVISPGPLPNGVTPEAMKIGSPVV